MRSISALEERELVSWQKPGEYKMIDTIKIQNFRCFKNVCLSNCKRINIIVGRNASGKTALLESIFLASGASPEITLRIKGWRGEDTILAASQPFDYGSLWHDLFHMFDNKGQISIRFLGSSGFGRTLSIFHEEGSEIVVPLGQAAGPSKRAVPIRFVYEDENKKRYEVSPVIEGTALKLPVASLPPVWSSFFATQMPPPVEQYAGFFSDLSKKRLHQPVITAVQSEFDFLEDITVEIGAGGQHMLYGTVSHLPEKIPLIHLSSGINKLLCIILAIAIYPRSIILIDEIENGFYFDRLPQIWSIILRFAIENNAQIFASTHSMECLVAAADAARNHKNLFGVIRTVNIDGMTEIRQFDGDKLVDAVKEGIEIR